MPFIKSNYLLRGKMMMMELREYVRHIYNKRICQSYLMCILPDLIGFLRRVIK